MSSDEEGPIRGVNSARRQRLFSDDDDDDRSVASGHSRGGSPRHDAGGRSDQRFNDGDRPGRDKDTDEEEEEEERRKAEERQKKEEAKKKKPKGPVKRQMISEDMLTGKNGISKLPEIFENFNFGGKGREKEDLNLILAKYEHWIHLLHPKHPFDQCLQRIEFLGLKRKVVKVHLKKLRMGMLSNFEGDDNALVEDDLNDQDLNLDEALEAASVVGGSKSQPGMSDARATSINANNADEFPDDDELAEIMNQETSGSGARKEVSSGPTQAQSQPQAKIPPTQMDDFEDMDIDFDEPFDDDNDDDYFQKQIDAQLKMAELAEKQVDAESTSVTACASTSAVADATTMLIPTCDVRAAIAKAFPNECDSGEENELEEPTKNNSDDTTINLKSPEAVVPERISTDDGPPSNSETAEESTKIISNPEETSNEDGIDFDDLADGSDSE